MLLDVGILSSQVGTLVDCCYCELDGSCLKRASRLSSSHLCPAETWAFVITRRILPGVWVGLTCKHHLCCWKISWKVFFVLLSWVSETAISEPSVESSILETGIVVRVEKNLLFSWSRLWYSECLIMVAMPHKKNTGHEQGRKEVG